jgi:hypothetical protein
MQSKSAGGKRVCLPKTPSRTTSEAIVDSTFPSRRIRDLGWIWEEGTKTSRREGRGKEEENSRTKREAASYAVLTTISLSPPAISPRFRLWTVMGKKKLT